MTTTFQTIKFALPEVYCHDVSQEKQRFWAIFLSAPSALTHASFIFIFVSLSLTNRYLEKDSGKPRREKHELWFCAFLYTEQMDAEGLGRKLLLTPPW